MQENRDYKNQNNGGGVKKLIALIVILILAASAFDYYQQHKVKINSVAQQSLSKASELASSAKKEVVTPGALRSSINETGAYLTRAGTINFTNIERQQNNLPALKENSLLNKAAQAKVKDMFMGQYFEHISPNGIGPSGLADAAGYAYIAVGENLALGNFKNDQALVEAWMNSKGHRENILSGKYTEIGVAVMEGVFEGKKIWLAVQEFGRPLSDCPSVDQNIKNQIEIIKAEAERLEAQINALKSYLENTEPKTKPEVEEYNRKVDEFNNLVRAYNNKVDWLKNLTAEYNKQVQAYNACLGQ